MPAANASTELEQHRATVLSGEDGLLIAVPAHHRASGVYIGWNVVRVAVRDLAVADGGVPLLAGWLARPRTATFDEQFELGLEFLLDGIAGRLPRSRRRRA
jgi:hypothetical protein